MTTETLRWLFSITFDCVKENLNGFSDAEMLSDPKPAGNCAAWILGHIVCYRDNVLQILGAEPLMDTAVRPQFEYGVKSPDKSKFPPPEQLFEMLEESHKQLNAGLDRQTAETLAESIPAVFEGGKPDSRFNKIMFFHFHESYHAGQLGLLRRLVGKSGAI